MESFSDFKVRLKNLQQLTLKNPEGHTRKLKCEADYYSITMHTSNGCPSFVYNWYKHYLQQGFKEV